jgi:hypothetical protein
VSGGASFSLSASSSSMVWRRASSQYGVGDAACQVSAGRAVAQVWHNPQGRGRHPLARSRGALPAQQHA